MITAALFLGLLGLAMGSFIDAFTWRLHTKRDFVADRSECEHCHHKLSVADLIPVLSWLLLKGRCRYCHKKISPLVPITEVTVSILFVASYYFWPLGFTTWQADVLFGFWLLYIVLLGALFIYDLRWMLLPDKIVFPLIAIGFIDGILRTSLLPGATLGDYAAHSLLGAAMLGGVYGLLHSMSSGKWVGMGDVKLGIFMGLVLGWQKSLLVLGLANCLGLLVAAPGLMLGKLTRKSRLPFGPFLIAAFLMAGLFGEQLIRWYIGVVTGL